MPDSDVYASPAHKEALLNALANRAAELGYSHASLEDMCGLAQGHVGKVFGPSRSKGLGFDTLYLLLPALGLKFILATDRDALHRYAERGLKRNGNQARMNNLAAKCGKRTLERALHHLAAFDWNEVLHVLAKARAAVAAEQTVKAARKAAIEANKQPPASNEGRRNGKAHGAAKRPVPPAASAFDAPMVEAMREFEEIAATSSIRVSRKGGERRGAKRGRVSAPFPPMDQHAINRRTQARHAKPVTVSSV
jgi:hypothetical protein